MQVENSINVSFDFNNVKKDKIQKGELNLDEQEKKIVQELQKTDAEVRAHESAHQAASGGLAGAASFTYKKGPDGKMYAVAGEVPISLQKGSTPQETLSIAKRVSAAALAPANPSPQDYSVAAKAKGMEIEAYKELMKEKQNPQSDEKQIDIKV